MVQANIAPSSWNAFKEALRTEFIPSDHVRRARDRLRRLRQTHSVSKYLSLFRNVALTITDMNAGEKLDKFVDGLKQEIRIEVMKSSVSTFEEAAQVALRVDSAIYASGSSRIGAEATRQSSSYPTPMEIGNIESSASRSGTPNNTRAGNIAKKNACRRCGKIGCRPWKCNPRVSNVEVRAENHRIQDGLNLSDSDSDEENE